MENKLKTNKAIGTMIQSLLIIVVPFVTLFYIGIVPNVGIEDVKEYILKAIIIPLFLYYFSYIITIALHELGHLIMGIKNRGTLVEYNFLLFSIYKKGQKTKFKFRGLTTGLGGMCVMDFPQNLKQAEFFKFCIGGPCVNFILVIIFSIIAILSLNNNILLQVSLYMVFINLGFGMSNIIPFETVTGVETDGMKIYRMKTEKNYIDNLNKAFKIREFLKNGGELKNIPNDLIYKPDQIRNKSDMEMMIFYISKIIELKKYDEAKKLIDNCLNENQNILSAISKNNLRISLIDIYLEKGETEKIDETYDEDLFKYIEMLYKLEKAIGIYVYLYYIICKNDSKLNSVKKELEKYFDENSDSKLSTVKEAKRTYSLINKLYKQ